jgi:hypothetical protein
MEHSPLYGVLLVHADSGPSSKSQNESVLRSEVSEPKMARKDVEELLSDVMVPEGAPGFV